MRPFDCVLSARQLDFFARGEAGALVRCKVRLSAVVGFGIEHEPCFTTAGTFTRWVRWGYLRTRNATYRISQRLVRRLQRAWCWELVAKRARVGIRRRGLGSVHRVIDWDFALVKASRRGARFPRSRRGLRPVPCDETEIILYRGEPSR